MVFQGLETAGSMVCPFLHQTPPPQDIDPIHRWRVSEFSSSGEILTIPNQVLAKRTRECLRFAKYSRNLPCKKMSDYLADHLQNISLV
jgi:hypothetical protein